MFITAACVVFLTKLLVMFSIILHFASIEKMPVSGDENGILHLAGFL